MLGGMTADVKRLDSKNTEQVIALLDKQLSPFNLKDIFIFFNMLVLKKYMV